MADLPVKLDLEPDGRCRSRPASAPLASPQRRCWWSVQGGFIVFDFESSRLRRTLRVVSAALGLAINPATRTAFELSGDRLVTTEADGTQSVWTRAPADE
jgi:hypothetical protein